MKDIIKKHLDKMAAQDFAFAERYKDPKKSLSECMKYITSQAKKKVKSGGVWLEDSIVYGWAVHYYQEEDLKVEPVKGQVRCGHIGGDMKPTDVAETKVVHTTEKTTTISGNTTTTTTIKSAKAIVKDKRDNKCVELDLFSF